MHFVKIKSLIGGHNRALSLFQSIYETKLRGLKEEVCKGMHHALTHKNHRFKAQPLPGTLCAHRPSTTNSHHKEKTTHAHKIFDIGCSGKHHTTFTVHFLTCLLLIKLDYKVLLYFLAILFRQIFINHYIYIFYTFYMFFIPSFYSSRGPAFPIAYM